MTRSCLVAFFLTAGTLAAFAQSQPDDSTQEVRVIDGHRVIVKYNPHETIDLEITRIDGKRRVPMTAAFVARTPTEFEHMIPDRKNFAPELDRSLP